MPIKIVTLQNRIKNLFRALSRVGAAICLAFLVIAALNFPFSYDRPQTTQEIEAARKYYEDAYRRQPAADKTKAETEYQTRYEEIAQAAADEVGIEARVRKFVEDFNLKDKRVLDIGSGRGHLQHLVVDYTGLDISPSVAHRYTKKFVVGSATAMPFADNLFDAAWSIFVIEHISDPGRAFAETRRVIRNGGLLFLMAGWNAGNWLADGYEVRPYSDFGLWGKLIKASVPIRSSPTYAAITLLPVRGLRYLAAALGPTELRYHPLKANYDTYWQPDSDATNSLDIYEGLLWFLSRGDECLNCEDAPILMHDRRSLIIRVNKG